MLSALKKYLRPHRKANSPLLTATPSPQQADMSDSTDATAVLRSRLRGALYGLAVGDALGAPYEFQRRGKYEVSQNMEDSYTFLHEGKPLKAGTWTDDTRLALRPRVLRLLLICGYKVWRYASLLRSMNVMDWNGRIWLRRCTLGMTKVCGLVMFFRSRTDAM